MTLTSAMIWGGSALALVGLAMLGWCIWRALAIRRSADPEGNQAALQTLVAVNMAAVGIASLGLGCLTVGLIL